MIALKPDDNIVMGKSCVNCKHFSSASELCARPGKTDDAGFQCARQGFKSWQPKDPTVQESFRYWQQKCRTAAAKSGWEHNLTVEGLAKALVNIGAEVSEAWEEVREHGVSTEIYHASDNKPLGLPVELADIVLRVFSLAEALGVDLEPVMREKLAYNATRPHMHGKKA